MKKIILLIMCIILAVALAACGSNDGAGTGLSGHAPETGESQEAAGAGEEAGTAEADKDVLVVYFSRTGNTKEVAEKIAAVTGADLYEITAAQEYTDGDLDWNNENSRTTKEQNDTSVRPEIGSDPVSLEGYSTIYIGYPIWWGQEPRIMDTFVESCNFDGKTVIPFCTSASSGIGSSGSNLEALAGNGTWLDGQRFGAGASEEEIASWVNSTTGGTEG